MRHRNANACALVRRRDQEVNVCRSCSESTSSAFGRPRPAMHRSLRLLNHPQESPPTQLDNEFKARDTRPSGAVKLTGEQDLWRIRVGNHGIVYSIEDKRLIVTLVRVAHRSEVYRRL